jgi:Fe-S-cluster containining protein
LSEKNDDDKKVDKGDKKGANQIKEGKKAPGKYVFECQKCGQCCEKKNSVAISMADLERWNKDMTLPSLFPFLTIELKNDDWAQISLKKPDSKEDKIEKGCPLYDAENKICNIYFSMPLYCKSFPLGYDGERYFLKDKNCPGIGKGKMSEEELKEVRKTAKEDFEARVSTTLLLPVMNSLAVKFLMEQSKKQIENLTDEQKDRLKDIFGEDVVE